MAIWTNGHAVSAVSAGNAATFEEVGLPTIKSERLLHVIEDGACEKNVHASALAKPRPVLCI